MSDIIISGITIRRDEHGRYCLNDLHRASGGASRDQPGKFFETQQTQALVAELESEAAITGIPVIQSKQGLGTFVAKELVYAYAMWISAAFHLKVIRAYDTMVTAKPVPAELTRMELLQIAIAAEQEKIELSEQKAKVEAELAIAAPKADALDLIAADDKSLTVTQAAKVLGIKRGALTDWLSSNGWVYRQNGSWVAYTQHIQNGRLLYKEARYTDENTGQECHRPYCHITQKGLTVIAQRLIGDAA
ncbi:phage antirepressor KilAC domain-containing protein [Herbaspirillum huttiense]|uniref:phage antirepressor KilAC domain-containing protein n=1 Tax=Herbaspirillum huttiense TaxID=863372 RepID=UPI002E7A7DB7|nr:phage antirepressor KilAC domain-containing protein [Herbaspirillum huttiense]MEE1636328.1 phage antirepressor KilAC domain-containing protein [Herbaspirillum huttiense NC40101]